MSAWTGEKPPNAVYADAAGELSPCYVDFSSEQSMAQALPHCTRVVCRARDRENAYIANAAPGAGEATNAFLSVCDNMDVKGDVILCDYRRGKCLPLEAQDVYDYIKLLRALKYVSETYGKK